MNKVRPAKEEAGNKAEGKATATATTSASTGTTSGAQIDGKATHFAATKPPTATKQYTRKLGAPRPINIKLTAQAFRVAENGAFEPASELYCTSTSSCSERHVIARLHNEKLQVECTPRKDSHHGDSKDGVLKLVLRAVDAGNGDAFIGSVDLDASKYLHDAGHLGHLGYHFGENAKYTVPENERSAAAVAANVPTKWFSAAIRLDTTLVSRGRTQSKAGVPQKVRRMSSALSLGSSVAADVGIGGPVFTLKLKRIMQVFSEIDDRSEEKKVAMKLAKERKRDVYFSLAALVLFLILGTFVYPVLEGWAYLDACFFAFVTLTTVGYGDISPVSQEGRLFTVFFVGMGICIIGVALGVIGDYVIHEQARISKEMIAKAQNLALNDYESSDDDDHDGHGNAQNDPARGPKKVVKSRRKSVVQREDDRKKLEQIVQDKKKKNTWLGCLKHLIKVLLPMIIVLGIGVAVMIGTAATDVDARFVDQGNCTAADAANTWVEGREECRVPWTFVDALYWSVVTGTTVGYGDLTPETPETKVFGMFYLLVSVVVTAKSLSHLGDWVLSLGHVDLASSVLDRSLTQEYLMSLDVDGNGQVSEFEYLSAMLVRLKYLEGKDLDQIMATFRKLDGDGSGTLSVADLAANLKSSKTTKRRGKDM
jgi:hypothetical protein